ncbi:Rha family transcriptional regulator [Salmonella enterica]|nr:Rha family transcriptional regulator [Salmonella enterica]
MNTTIAVSTESPKVFFNNGRLVTTSQAIADYFDKQHKHVLEKIRSLDCSPEFTTANFSTVVIKVQAGFMEKDAEGYEVTKDGFMFLVMGFTGKKAARLKEAYIAKFNAMEVALEKPAPAPRSGSYDVVISFLDGQPVSTRIAQPGEIFIHPSDHAEMMARSGYLTIHWKDLISLPVAELAMRAEEVMKKQRDWLS